MREKQLQEIKDMNSGEKQAKRYFVTYTAITTSYIVLMFYLAIAPGFGDSIEKLLPWRITSDLDMLHPITYTCISGYVWFKVALNIRKISKMRYIYWSVFILISIVNFVFLLYLGLAILVWLMHIS